MRRKELLDPWNHASVKVMDVRHQIVQPMEVFSYSSLPSSVYVYAVRGQAEVMLDQLVHPVFGCDVIHCGKGIALEIVAEKTEFEFYILFYKAVIPLQSHQVRLRWSIRRRSCSVFFRGEIGQMRQPDVVNDTFQDRQLLVYLPDGYGDSGQRYPVVYLQDSGDLIERNDSDVLMRVRDLATQGELPGFIFVGVESFDRHDEYTPFVYTALTYSEVFGRIGSFSGSFWFPGMIEWLEQRKIGGTGQRLYMNLGHAEGATRTNGQQWMVPNSKKVYDYLLQNGFTESTARQEIYESEFHSLELGVQYVLDALKWLYWSE